MNLMEFYLQVTIRCLDIGGDAAKILGLHVGAGIYNLDNRGILW